MVARSGSDLLAAAISRRVRAPGAATPRSGRSVLTAPPVAEVWAQTPPAGGAPDENVPHYETPTFGELRGSSHIFAAPSVGRVVGLAIHPQAKHIIHSRGPSPFAPRSVGCNPGRGNGLARRRPPPPVPGARLVAFPSHAAGGMAGRGRRHRRRPDRRRARLGPRAGVHLGHQSGV